MKQFSIGIAFLLLSIGCIGETGGDAKNSQMLLGLINEQKTKITVGEDRTSSQFTIILPGAYVDSVSGNDSNPGTQAAPFRTITKAILYATSKNYKIIAVAPGTYSASIGETFPIVIPDGMTVYGDFNGKGLLGGSSSLYAGPPSSPKTGATLISGNGPDTASGYNHVTLKLKSNAKISGFKITNPKPFDNTVYSTTVLLTGMSTATVSDNTIEGIFGGNGIHINSNGSSSDGAHIISDNSILSNYTGISDYTWNRTNKIQNNVISHNNVGIKTVYIKLDLGQGATGSVGGNTFSCNNHQDLELGAGASGQTLYALNNSWDHMAPSTFNNYSSYGIDIVNYNYATIVYYAGGTVASGACD